MVFAADKRIRTSRFEFFATASTILRSSSQPQYRDYGASSSARASEDKTDGFAIWDHCVSERKNARRLLHFGGKSFRRELPLMKCVSLLQSCRFPRKRYVGITTDIVY